MIGHQFLIHSNQHFLQMNHSCNLGILSLNIQTLLTMVHLVYWEKYTLGQHINLMRSKIIPLLIFGDDAIIDDLMKKSMEPFSFTLGIFRQHVRLLPSVRHTLGDIKINPSTLYTNEQVIEGHRYWAEYNIHEDDSEYVLDTKHEFHSQSQCCVVGGILHFQKLTTGMNFKLPWIPNNDKFYPMKTLINLVLVSGNLSMLAGCVILF